MLDQNDGLVDGSGFINGGPVRGRGGYVKVAPKKLSEVILVHLYPFTDMYSNFLMSCIAIIYWNWVWSQKNSVNRLQVKFNPVYATESSAKY